MGISVPVRLYSTGTEVSKLEPSSNLNSTSTYRSEALEWLRVASLFIFVMFNLKALKKV